MLKKIQSRWAYHLSAMTSSLNLLCRKPMATLMTVMVIAIALTLPTLFWVFTDNINKLIAGWQNSGHISLYLKPALSISEQRELVLKVRSIDGVSQTSLISPEDGLAELKAQEGMQEIMRSIGENPLPAVIVVTPKVSVDSQEQLILLSKQLSAVPQVDEIKVDIEWIGRLRLLLGFVTKVVDSLLVLLALAVVFIIANTLRLAIQSQHEEIQILKLIGAKDSFIMRPFLYSGVWYGMAGAVVTLFLVNVFLFSLGAAINQLTLVYQMHYPLTGLSMRQVLLLFIFAIILGWLAASFSVKRQLAVIEP